MTNSSLDRRAKVLLVEDHAMFRERLAQLVNQDATMVVCGEADNIRDAMEIAERERPDIAVVDLTLKGSSGLELIKDLRSREIDLPVLALSMHEESLYAERVLAAGGRGYLTKNENSDTLLEAIRRVLSGKVYLSQRMTENVLGKFTGKEISEPAINRLADRELEVFQLIGTGRTTREIAETLSLGVTTIETYRTRIKEKLGLRNTAELQHRASVWMREAR